jgi:phenylpropionate dioxygenase-like ring-hydroxylating dioxygenase large terminal subunit
MRHEVQVQLIEEMLARLDAGVNVDAGGLRRNPTRVYVAPELAARERAAFFAGHPQMVGLSADLPEPGSFMTIDDLGVPIIAARADDGTFVAMINACRHRGARVVDAERGKSHRFTCPFHNWSYRTDGALAGLPKRDHFGHIDDACHGLVRLPAVERHGLLWVHADPSGNIDVDALLGAELADELAHWRLDELHCSDRDSYDVACNWKLAIDTFGETYHFPALHRNTINLGFHGNVACYETFGRNHRFLLCRRDIDHMRHLPREQWNIAVATLPAYWLFPNVQLLPTVNGCFLVRVYPHPTDPGRHTSRIGFYMRPGAGEGSEAAAARAAERTVAQLFASIISDEDYAMSASQQATANSGALKEVVFGRNEPALHHYHNTYRAALGMELLPLLDDANHAHRTVPQ